MRLAAGLVATVVIVAVLLAMVPEEAVPAGPAYSSYTTGRAGTAGLAELIERTGGEVDRIERPLGEARLAGEETVVLIGAGSFSSVDADALGSFVRRGGTLVVAGRRGPDLVDGIVLVASAPVAGGPLTYRPAAPLPEVAGLETVVTDGDASWSATGSGVPALATGDRALLVVEAVGAGRVVLIADPSPLQNHLLAEGDNAAMALQALGAGTRRVRFVETIHGFVAPVGLGALSGQWKLALAGLVAAAAVWIIARARRLGPPEQAGHRRDPPRSLYVAALAAELARADGAVRSVAVVRGEVVDMLQARFGLSRAPSPEELAAVAARAGLDPPAVAALEADGEAGDPVAVGRALARLRTGGTR